MQFHFQLQNIEEIHPWGNRHPTLHWFGITYGWFWIEVGGQELFRYTQAIRQHHAILYPRSVSPLPYEDYQVSRYWEDLMETLPAILDPVPKDLAIYLTEVSQWQEWENKVYQWVEKRDDDEAWDLYDAAVRWWWKRRWGARHLSNPPNLQLWTVGETTHIRWDNRFIVVDGIRVWEADFGEFSLPVSEFRDAVRSFHTRLMGEMEERVILARQAWPRPRVKIDLDILEKEQADRVTWLDRALKSTAREYEWEEVRSAIARLEAEVI